MKHRLAKEMKTEITFYAGYLVFKTAVRATWVPVIRLYVPRTWFMGNKDFLITDVSAPVKPSLRVITTTANTYVSKIGLSAARHVPITPAPDAPIARRINFDNDKYKKRV